LRRWRFELKILPIGLKFLPIRPKIFRKNNILSGKISLKKYFKSEINDPENYDLVINMEKIKIKSAIEMIKLGMKSQYLMGTKEFWE
jgi:hypothetical protein